MVKKISLGLVLTLLAAIVSAQSGTQGGAARAGRWFMAQTDKAQVASVVATSELVEAQYGGKYLYPPTNILDGNFDSIWCEAQADGPGLGESITVEFAEAVSFDEIQIVNGFASKDYYLKNNRVKSLVITQVAGEHFQQKEYTLKDGVQTWQSIGFALPQTAVTITIKITGVYKGSKYDDTCLGDIRLLYQGRVIPFTGVEELKKIQEENSRQMLKVSAADFEKQFFALFYGNDVMYLKGQKTGDVMVISRSGEEIDSVRGDAEWKLIASPPKADFIAMFKKDYGGRRDTSAYNQTDSEFVLLGYEWWGYYRQQYWKIGNGRILKTDVIDYVETTTAVIVKIEGNTIFWNGVPYTVLTAKQVSDWRVYDGP